MIQKLKDWVLSWDFVVQAKWDKEYNEWIEFELNRKRAQIIMLAQKDFQETLADDNDKKIKELMEKKLAEMMSPIQWQHVLSFNERQGAIYIGATRGDASLLQSLRAEAEMLTGSELWKLLYETPNALAQQIMFRTGEDTDAFKKGRAMIFHLDSQKKILDTLKAYKAPVIPNSSSGSAGM